MYAPERQQSILDTARTAGRVEVIALADMLGVTPETVRRDLRVLERRGFLRRVHGGALPVDKFEPEPTVAIRRDRASAEKRRIAARALQEVPVGGTILLDSGTTTQVIADQLPLDIELTVLTNSPTIALALQGHQAVELHLLGGRLRRRTGATVGAWLQDALTDVCVDVAFLGANGFSVERGLTTHDQVEAAAKRCMLTAARQPVVVADASKAGQVQLHRFAHLGEVDLLITDAGLDDETAERLDAAGTGIVRV